MSNQQLMNFAEFLASQNQEPRAPARPIHEAQIMTLQELFAVYRVPRFKAGDVIMPRKGSVHRWEGEPCIVLETRYGAEPLIAPVEDPTEYAAPFYGARLDLRVACFSGHTYNAYWVESWGFEFYQPPAAARPIPTMAEER